MHRIQDQSNSTTDNILHKDVSHKIQGTNPVGTLKTVLFNIWGPHFTQNTENDDIRIGEQRIIGD